MFGCHDEIGCSKKRIGACREDRDDRQERLEYLRFLVALEVRLVRDRFDQAAAEILVNMLPLFQANRGIVHVAQDTNEADVLFYFFEIEFPRERRLERARMIFEIRRKESGAE